MSSEDNFRRWSDERVRVTSLTPGDHLQNIRAAASSTPKGLSKPFGRWLVSPDAQRYAETKTLRVTWGRIGANIRWGRFPEAIRLWREIGREDKAQQVIRRGMPSDGGLGRTVNQDRPIRRGMKPGP